MIERAVRDFLNALGPDLRRRAVFPFAAEERWNWHYIPKARNGVPLTAMTEARRQAAAREHCAQYDRAADHRCRLHASASGAADTRASGTDRIAIAPRK